MTVRKTLAVLLLWGLASNPGYAQDGASGLAAERTAQWRTLVQSLEPAAYVRIRLVDGRSLKGTIVSSANESLMLAEHTRIPVPPRLVPFAQVASVDRAREGLNPGVKVLIGAGSIAASAVLLMAAMFAAAYD